MADRGGLGHPERMVTKRSHQNLHAWERKPVVLGVVTLVLDYPLAPVAQYPQMVDAAVSALEREAHIQQPEIKELRQHPSSCLSKNTAERLCSGQFGSV
eukprot:3519192-Amphidinium_carterae.2